MTLAAFADFNGLPTGAVPGAARFKPRGSEATSAAKLASSVFADVDILTCDAGRACWGGVLVRAVGGGGGNVESAETTPYDGSIVGWP